MVNYILELRKALFRHYYFWALFAAGFGGGIVVLAMKRSHKSPTLVFVPLLLGGHYILSLGVFLKGRYWKHDIFGYALQWWGMSVLQIMGFAASVLIGYAVDVYNFSPFEVVLCCAYAFSMSQLLQFIVRLDITSAWMSTTAYVAWNNSNPETKDILIAIGVSAVLVIILILRNFLDDLQPEEDLERDGKKPCCFPTAVNVAYYHPAPFRTRGPPAAPTVPLANQQNIPLNILQGHLAGDQGNPGAGVGGGQLAGVHADEHPFQNIDLEDHNNQQ